MAQLNKDDGHPVTRQTRRQGIEGRPDDYAGPDDWRPRDARPRHITGSLLGVLTAGLLLLALVVAVYLLLPGREDVPAPAMDTGVRVPLSTNG